MHACKYTRVYFLGKRIGLYTCIRIFINRFFYTLQRLAILSFLFYAAVASDLQVGQISVMPHVQWHLIFKDFCHITNYSGIFSHLCMPQWPPIVLVFRNIGYQLCHIDAIYNHSYLCCSCLNHATVASDLGNNADFGCASQWHLLSDI